ELLLGYDGPRARGTVEQARGIDREWGCEHGVSAEEVHLELHRDAAEAGEVDVVPRFLEVAARAVVADVDDVIVDGVPEDVVQDTQLVAQLLRSVLRVREVFAIRVAEVVRTDPAANPEPAEREHGSQRGLEQRLTGLAVLPAEGRAVAAREGAQRRQLRAHIRGEVEVRDAVREREPGIRHRRRDCRVTGQDRTLERVEVTVDLGLRGRLEGGKQIDQDHTVPAGAERPELLPSSV